MTKRNTQRQDAMRHDNVQCAIKAHTPCHCEGFLEAISSIELKKFFGLPEKAFPT
ncbi:MAG TPA: hypothetical protein ACFYDZ_09950 [Candidatus Brocadiaceae bacterium]